MSISIQQISLSLSEAYTALIEATSETQKATAEHASASLDLTEARQAIIAKYSEDPKALGSNETARNAKLDELTVIERQDLNEKAETLRDARDKQELMRLSVEHWRAQLRCHEVAAGLVINGGAR